jgi:hypothetical protein
LLEKPSKVNQDEMKEPRELSKIEKTTTHGLKEWNVVVEALRAGSQVLLLRKGGIHEPGGEFKAAHGEFFLFPSLEHQKKDLLKPAALARFAPSLEVSADAASLRLDTFAQLTEAIELDDPGKARRLSDHHVWNDAYVQMRIDYKPEKPLNLLLLRVFVLPVAIDIPRLERYAGCRSWVEFGEELSFKGGRAVLKDKDFEERVRAVRKALDPP